MTYIEAINEYGLVVRKSALSERSISTSDFSNAMIDVDVSSENDNLISYGPLFGIEALENLKEELQSIGLVYIDDFYGFDFFLPDWIKLGIAFSD